VLKQPEIQRMWFANEIDDFAKWMTEERGMSALTMQSYRRKISLFLKWFSERHRSFAAVRLGDMDDFLIFKGANG
jgi:site-specific recombinase XerD